MGDGGGEGGGALPASPSCQHCLACPDPSPLAHSIPACPLPSIPPVRVLAQMPFRAVPVQMDLLAGWSDGGSDNEPAAALALVPVPAAPAGPPDLLECMSDVSDPGPRLAPLDCKSAIAQRRPGPCGHGRQGTPAERHAVAARMRAAKAQRRYHELETKQARLICSVLQSRKLVRGRISKKLVL